MGKEGEKTKARPVRVALTGPVALELVAPYFRSAGYDVPPPDMPLGDFGPDFVYDVTSHNAVLAREIPGFFDERMRRLAGSPYSLDGIRAIVDEFAWERLRSPRKILAVDADNTLWRGILSEDGGDTLVPFAEFQSGLKSLAERGAVLVLLSKNDPFPLSPTPYFRIPESFATSRINWEPKAWNLIDACRELNLSPDSAVFVDDNPHERAQMAAHLPGVAIAPFPEDLARPAQFLRRLEEYFFADTGRTAEDRLRAADYRANALREACLSHADYLDDLDLRVAPSRATPDDLDRLTQMAGKTNQFNATTLHRTREDFAALLENPAYGIWVFRARDRFGEQGLVCYVIAERASARITDFVMSCRAMGRTLEHFAYRYVSRELGRKPTVDFVPTAKNAPFAAFIASLDELPPTHYRTLHSCSQAPASQPSHAHPAP